jgi:WD40-like Beta Propeller Repeat
MWGALAAAVVLGSSSVPATPPSRIVFRSSRTNVSQLYSVEPSGQGLAQLTFGADDWLAPLPSPDGRFVTAFRGYELWLMRGDGRDARLLAQAGVARFDSPSWSRDSRRLAFAKDGAIWTVAAAGGPPRQVTHGAGDSEPTFSPDGRSIAFLRPNSEGAGDMLVVRRRGRERVVTYEVSGKPVWSPDGKWIAVSAAGSSTLELVRPSSGAHKVVVDDCACALTGGAWSPDSRRLAYVNGEGIHIVERSGRGWRQRLLLAPPGPEFAWSPRGKAIAFAIGSGVEIVSLAGGVRTLVPFRSDEALWGLSWSWAATDLAYQKPEEVLFLVQVSPRELEARVPIRQFSADGDRVAYFLCPHIFGIWRPGEGQPLFPGRTTLPACRPPENEFVNYVSDLALAGDRLAYLTSLAANSVWTRLMLTTFNPCCASEGFTIVENGAHYDWRPALDDVVGARRACRWRPGRARRGRAP